MRVLFDTNAFLAFHVEPERLGSHLDEVEDPSTERLVSAVVGWEIAIKHGLGRLELPTAPSEWVVSMIDVGRMAPLPIELVHALGVSELPPHHRDPFDRLLIAVARDLGVPILTSDRIFDRYDVETLSF